MNIVGMRFSFVVSCALMSLYAVVVESKETACPSGEYFIAALGGFVLIPARYVLDSLNSDDKASAAYRSPAPPMFDNCFSDEIARAAGSIEVGSAKSMRELGQLPRGKPALETVLQGFEVSVWHFSLPKDASKQRTTAFIRKNDKALLVFDGDPQVWRRIVTSYQAASAD